MPDVPDTIIDMDTSCVKVQDVSPKLEIIRRAFQQTVREVLVETDGEIMTLEEDVQALQAASGDQLVYTSEAVSLVGSTGVIASYTIPDGETWWPGFLLVEIAGFSGTYTTEAQVRWQNNASTPNAYTGTETLWPNGEDASLAIGRYWKLASSLGAFVPLTGGDKIEVSLTQAAAGASLTLTAKFYFWMVKKP